MSIRETIVAWLAAELADQMTGYDVRRVRGRPVDTGESPSISLNVTVESAIEDTLHDAVIATCTIEVTVAAIADTDADIDDAVTAAHAAIMADPSAGGSAESITYTGCVWSYQDGGDGLAISAALAFDVQFRHQLADMASPPT